MTLRDAAALSSVNLRGSMTRTLLTILGLAVGVAAILTVLTLGQAGEAQVEVEIDHLGVDRVWITAARDSEQPLQPEDSGAVAAAVGTPACAGAYTLGPVRLGDETLLAQINGYDAGVEAVHHPLALAGRLFTEREYASGAPVALVDEAIDGALGGALGQRIDIGSRKVRVVGVVRGMTALLGSAAEGLVMLPLTTFMDTYAQGVTELTVSVPGGCQADAVGEAALSALSGRGGIYRATTFQEEIDAARSVMRIFVMVLLCVAAVCMLTGAIGVMNILLVSVRERRREIGLMKAVGATSRQVGLLFLLEAVCYALLGGALGVLLGGVMIRLFGEWIGLSASLSLRIALPTALAASGLGVLFGVAPALRAAALMPVDALRQE